MERMGSEGSACHLGHSDDDAEEKNLGKGCHFSIHVLGMYFKIKEAVCHAYVGVTAAGILLAIW